MRERLRLPVIGAPLFIISGPDLVIAQCKAGVVGAFPALNARPSHVLEEWLKRIPAFHIAPRMQAETLPGQVLGVASLPLAWPH